MLEQQKNFKVVKLGAYCLPLEANNAEKTEVLVRTELKDAYIPALRSGFAGYPVNPRWSGVKFYAWKKGRQWRQALLSGEMVIRSADSMLVPFSEAEEPDPNLTSKSWGHLTKSLKIEIFPSRQKQLTV